MRLHPFCLPFVFALLSAGACAGTTTRVHTAYSANPSEQFLVEVAAPLDVSTTAIAILQDRLERGFQARRMLAEEGSKSAKTVHVAIQDYRMRGARQLGILAGKDRIRSEVQIIDPTSGGVVVGAYEVETETAAESANTSDLVDEHVEAIFAGMR